MKGLYNNLRMYNLKGEYDHVDIGPKLGLQEKVLVSVRRDTMALVKALFALSLIHI